MALPAYLKSGTADFYEALGVAPEASHAEIGAAYWRLAGEQRERLPALNEAYEVLSHAQRRVAYDMHRRHHMRRAAPRQTVTEVTSPTQAPVAVPAVSGVRQKLNWYLR